MGKAILGLDLGTSGLRGCIVADGMCVARATTPLSEHTPQAWEAALNAVMTQLRPVLPEVAHIIADATSSTVMLWANGPASPVRMYDHRGHSAVVAALADILPPDSGAHGASSTLAKVLQLKARAVRPHGLRIAHQIDWLNAHLLDRLPPTDWNNALKLGFDPISLSWPQAIRALLHPLPAPEVVAPGTPLGTVSPRVASRWGLRRDTLVHAGTTDSIAAFLATGAGEPGDAVTSLGSTLAVKLLSSRPVFAPHYGIYSHRLPTGWLAGGASNAGGRVLLMHFSREELQALSARLNPHEPTGLDYYPLPVTGERFPFNDSKMKAKIEPIPEDRTRFLQGLLEGLSEIERLGYERLVEL
uniref:FGGY-family carbohydrate kinase n=1 Tax=Sulfurivirga sp. TaxID=2614236 RepID=UPI0025D99190